jgi:hypothetical protein
MRDTWRRDIPQWHNLKDVQEEALSALRVASEVEGRVLSRAKDIEESASLVLRLPAGWAFAPPAESGTLELFVAGGSLSVAGRRLGVGGFVAIPGGCDSAKLTCSSGAEVLVFWNQFRRGDCYPDGHLFVHETAAVEWSPVVAPGMPHGSFFKPLRFPYFSEQGFGGPAGNLTLVASLPSFHTEDGEHHDDTWEELVCLSGDTYFPTRGTGGAGTVINNPAWFEHGPFGTHRGHVVVMQALRPIRINRAPLPGGPQAMEHYLDTQPLFSDPLRTEHSNALAKQSR